MGKIAVITGISGQDGSYLAELLVKKKYKVYGILNPQKKKDLTNLKSIQNKLFFENIQSNPARVFRIVFHRKDSSWMYLRNPEYRDECFCFSFIWGHPLRMDFQKEPHDRIIIHTDPCLPYFEHCSFGREPISPNLLGDVLSGKRVNHRSTCETDAGSDQRHDHCCIPSIHSE